VDWRGIHIAFSGINTGDFRRLSGQARKFYIDICSGRDFTFIRERPDTIAGRFATGH
jgi:hypothetical protein